MAAYKDTDLLKNLHAQLKDQPILLSNRYEDIREDDTSFSIRNSGKCFSGYDSMCFYIIDRLVINFDSIILNRFGK